MPIRALFMDLDNTLANDSESLRLSLAAIMPVLTQLRPDLSSEDIYQTFRKVNDWHWEYYDDSPIAAMTRSVDVRTLIAQETLEALDRPNPELARELAASFQAARSKTYACYDDVIPVLQKLHGRIPLILITNGNAEMQREKIERCRLTPYLNAVFIAQEVGASKPAPPIFQRALDWAGQLPHETLMVGDNPVKDIQGAQNLGIQTAWMRRDGRRVDPPSKKPDYTVGAMTEILEIIEHHA